VVRWLFAPAGEVSEPGRAFLFGQLLGSPAAAVMGSLCALMVAVAALVRSERPIFIGFVALELLLVTGRLLEWRRRNRLKARDRGYVPAIDGSVMLSTLWCTLQGALAFTIMSGSDLLLSILSATLIMALVGPICARNYAAPRFALLLVLLCDLPFVAGALASGEPWLALILVMTPPFLLGAMQIIWTFHRSMLLTLSAQERTLHLAQHDWLTGILNRQGMDDALVQLPTAPGRQLALMSVDLDGFKQVNDRYGHGAGDILLVRVAERLKAQLSGDDLLARMGGDEFMIVIRDTAPDLVGAIADRLIAAVSRHAYDLGEGTVVRVGASIGFACLPQDATNTVELRLRADLALYAAKGAGKGVGRRYGTLAAAAPAIEPPTWWASA
jgi:diguanylate cyclase (GGDEF)-like protein